jgi:hypothetical protein
MKRGALRWDVYFWFSRNLNHGSGSGKKKGSSDDDHVAPNSLPTRFWPLRALPTQTLLIESISRRLYHKKLYSPMQFFYHGVYLIFLSDLLLPLY